MEILSANSHSLFALVLQRSLLVLLGAFAFLPTDAGAEDSLEYDVKAGFLYNFTKFVQWPEESFNGKNAPIVIGILGSDPFGEKFDRALSNEKSGGRPLIVKRFKTAQDVEGCHIVFVSDREHDQLPRLLEKLKDTYTMTAGESEDFTRGGGVIRFFLEQGKVRFEINISAARRKKLEISSQLLNLARIYRER
jgi:hypothetical protein